MLTVQSLLDELGLDLAAGAQRGRGAGALGPHLRARGPDPVALRRRADADHRHPASTRAAKQRAFVRLLADHNLAGLGFGTGFSHDKLPKALVEEAKKRDFPLFEVPYSTPFIAITEKAFARLVNEQYEVLQRGIAVQRRLERLVLEERGLEEIVATIASAVGGTVAILGGRGERLAGRGFRRELSSEAVNAIREEALAHTGDGHPFVPAHPAVAGRALAHPVISPGGGPPQAWVVIVRDSGGLGDFERLILQQAVAVVALELMRRRVARETERRLAGDVLAGALGGRLEPSELRRRLEPFGIGDEAAVLVFALDDPAAAEPALERALAADACPAVVAPHASGGRELLCAVVDAADRDPVDLAADARRALVKDRGAVRAAASRPAPPEELRHSFHEARCALEATAFDNGSAPEVASWRDLGAFTLLLSIQDDEALKLYCDSVLGPIESRRRGVRRRAAALAGGLHRAERPVGARRPPGLLPPPHAALPDAQSRGADRPRPLPRPRPDRVLAGAPRQGAGHVKIGVPSEIKPDEYRVAVTPAGVREMVEHGHEVLIEAGAGEGSAIGDADFEAQGARIVPDAATVFAEAEMVLKVKEPQPAEIEMLRPGQLLFTYLHLAPDPEQTRGLLDSGATCIAYETVEDARGRLPLLAPMSEIAGKIATQAGAFMLEKPLGGRGILLGGVPGVAAANVMVIGGGVVGMNAAFIAIGMEADVFVFDKSIDRLRELDVDLRRPLLDRLLDHAGGRGDAAPRRPGDRRRPRPRRPRALRRPARAAGADEARRRAGRRRDRPGRLLRDLAPDDPPRPDLRGRRDHPLLRRQHARRGADHLDPRAHQRHPALRDRARRPGRRRGDPRATPGCGPGVNVAGGVVTHPAVAEARGRGLRAGRGGART